MSVLKQVSRFVRDLMAYDEALILRGRQNFEREQFETAYIVVDALGPRTRRGAVEKFDPDTEEQTVAVLWAGTVTLDFYGDGAYTRANEFTLRMQTQAARGLRKSLALGAALASEWTDVKALTGQQYGERIQLSLVVSVTEQLVVPVLRIDTAQIEIRNEDGVQYVG